MLIANKDKVYEEFPTPLINRLEKHFLVTSTMLSQKQEKLVNKIKSWVEDFSRVSASYYSNWESKIQLSWYAENPF